MDLADNVKVSQEYVTIPTYEAGIPEKNPLFHESRVYQGSSGAVYPYPVIEKIADKKVDKEYMAVFLENKYIRIMVIPALGGRIHMAYDKIKKRDFIYHNHVIKPALVGLAGPWISGGIEFNWPQHHRPTTFEPVDYSLEKHQDGSATVWVSEVERMFHTKGMAGFRLYPDKAYLEIQVQLYNRTPFVQTFLWWANPAVKVNDHYQTVFPPDVHAVFDHGKRDVSEFPIARGTYYKVDYSRGVDISRYKNIPVPTSYMAIASKYDFMGGYEHDTKGGLLHVADHHISPGKKQWTWGNGAFGESWIRNLTDEDGPYIELMTGVFTDNQPDFSWLHPFEERSFIQYFMPYSEIGIVKNATKDALVNLEVSGAAAIIQFFTTAVYENAVASLMIGDDQIWSEKITVAPELPYKVAVNLPADSESANRLSVTLFTAGGQLLVKYKPEKPGEREIPQPAKVPLQPEEMTSIEELFLTGLHLEQYRHATYKATDYYMEALSREPGDIRSNNAMGRWFLKRGQFAMAEAHFRKAIETFTARNSNPPDGEPFFNLGLSLFLQDRFAESYTAFYKATWNAAWHDAAYFYLARIAVRNGDLEKAIQLADTCLLRNTRHHGARHLKAVILRKLCRHEEALTWVNQSLHVDKFNVGCQYEKYLLLKNRRDKTTQQAADECLTLILNNTHTCLTYSLDYAHAGQYGDAIDMLLLNFGNDGQPYPMIYYYLGFFSLRNHDKEKAAYFFQKATRVRPDYCFPNCVEDVAILQSAIAFDPEDPKAPFYLGNFWYAHRQHAEAVEYWELSLKADASFPTVHRNLALAYYNKLGSPERALQSLQHAFHLDQQDDRVLMELDQLYKRLNKPHADRLAFLEQHLDLVEKRDDLFLERITLYNHLNQYAVAKDLLRGRRFHPWEGGEGKVVEQYRICCTELARQACFEGRCQNALDLLEEAQVFPENLGEGKLHGASENDVFYLMGCAYEGLGKYDQANASFEKATIGCLEPVQAVYYNDQEPDKILYQGLAWRKLGNAERAQGIFKGLIDFGTSHMNDEVTIDYFAVSLPDLLVFDRDLTRQNKIHCHYLIGLGHFGLGDKENKCRALESFNRVISMDINHFGATIHASLARNETSPSELR